MKYHQNLSGVFLEVYCDWVLDPPQAIIQPLNCSSVLQKKKKSHVRFVHLKKI